ncbi:hypothetical protein PCL_03738 [Purpureocillium lilacinum]|uniref:Uncharacterized protein n=1 Tax=Purpureocillium lilacinum TaxID=33203 RepID=A0A2U3EPV9_PURLI|nr:hypothetical protein PCL_03738 [Purpureocillium lilacinum]
MASSSSTCLIQPYCTPRADTPIAAAAAAAAGRATSTPQETTKSHGPAATATKKKGMQACPPRGVSPRRVHQLPDAKGDERQDGEEDDDDDGDDVVSLHHGGGGASWPRSLPRAERDGRRRVDMSRSWTFGKGRPVARGKTV